MVVTLEMLQMITDAVMNQPAVIPDVVRLADKPMAVTVNRDGNTDASPRVTLDRDDRVGLGGRIKVDPGMLRLQRDAVRVGRCATTLWASPIATPP